MSASFLLLAVVVAAGVEVDERWVTFVQPEGEGRKRLFACLITGRSEWGEVSKRTPIEDGAHYDCLPTLVLYYTGSQKWMAG